MEAGLPGVVGQRNAASEERMKLYPYGDTSQLEVYGSFNALVKAGSQEKCAKFVVIKDKGQCRLLSLGTSQDLGLLEISINVGVNKVSGSLTLFMRRRSLS